MEQLLGWNARWPSGGHGPLAPPGWCQATSRLLSERGREATRGHRPCEPTLPARSPPLLFPLGKRSFSLCPSIVCDWRPNGSNFCSAGNSSHCTCFGVSFNRCFTWLNSCSNCSSSSTKFVLRFSQSDSSFSSDSGCSVMAAKRACRCTSFPLMLRLAVQLAPVRIDHGLIGPRNRFRAILAK